MRTRSSTTRSTSSGRATALAAGSLVAAAALAACAALAASALPAGPPQARHLPRLVFVSRRPGPPALSDSLLRYSPVPRFPGAHGRLVVREPDGRLHDLFSTATGLAAAVGKAPRLDDVAHPVASWDAKRVVFAARERPLDPWRIWVVGADGQGLAPVTHTDRALDLSPLGAGADTLFARYDDLDPAWLPDGRIVFSSTRFPQVSQRGRLPVPNLFAVHADGTGLERLTTERNGGEKPAIDPRTGRIVYARWFFSPYFARNDTTPGVTLDSTFALPHEHVDLWQAVSIFPDGDRIQLAGGDPRSHDSTACYAPCPLRDGTLVGVRPPPGALPPSIAGGDLVAYAGGVGAARVLARGGVASPVALGDGRIAFVSEREDDAEAGLYAVPARGGAIERIVDQDGVLELDPCPLVPRKAPPVLPAQGGIDDPAWLLPVTRLDQVQRMDDTFRFDCLNVFASGDVDALTPSAPVLTRDARIRFFATLARPRAATGDTVVLVREVRLTPQGGVHESDMPGDVPMFEQLVDAAGHVLMSAHGPAQVPGTNFARIGAGTKCVGCHAGHSTLPVPKNNRDARWFNASPSATVTASGVRAGCASPAALVDRVAKGPIERVGWVADGPGPPWARLAWATPIEARAFVLYAPWSDGPSGTHVVVRACTLVFLRRGREIGRVRVGAVRPAGTRIEIPPLVLDAVEVQPEAEGRVRGRPAVALAEVETIARLPDP